MSIYRKVIAGCILPLLVLSIISGQDIPKFNAKFYIGAMYYQGDLAPKPIDLSFGPGNLACGGSLGYNILDWVSINGRFIRGRISGDDAYSFNEARRDRNLSFASTITEYGLFADISINKWWKSLNKYGVRLSVNAGINIFKFNPKAYYQGTWIELQPLGTEG